MPYKVSIDTPALFITAVGKDRLPVFQTDKIKEIVCAAIDEARTSCGFLLFAYVLMPDHLHLLTDALLKPFRVLQYIKGIVGHRVIDYLKKQNYEFANENSGTQIGNVTIGSLCGSMTPMSFQLLANRSLWRK